MTALTMSNPTRSLKLRGSNKNQNNDSDERVCVFTILFGGFDKLRVPPSHLIDPSVSFYILTDREGAGHPAPWKEFVVSPLPYDNNRQNARSAKMVPPDELWNACDISIQVDANIDFLRSPLELAREFQPLANLGLIRHPFLYNYESEIEHLCQVYPNDCHLYRAHADKQANFDGHKAHQYETSVILRRHNDQTRKILTTWRDELFSSGHLRDQVVLVPMLHAHNADIELYGPGGKLKIPPPKHAKSNDPAVYTKPLQHGTDPPSFIQVYRGHNHDFAKWRCHAKVMGKQRSAFAHGAYCSVYYVTKRYVPWVESLAPITYNSIKAMDLKDPFKATLVSLLFLIFSLAVFFPQSTIMLRLRSHVLSSNSRFHTWCRQTSLGARNYEGLAKRGLLAVRLAILIAVGFFTAISYFYTMTMGIACLFSGVLLFAPPIFVALLIRDWYLKWRLDQYQRLPTTR